MKRPFVSRQQQAAVMMRYRKKELDPVQRVMRTIQQVAHKERREAERFAHQVADPDSGFELAEGNQLGFYYADPETLQGLCYAASLRLARALKAKGIGAKALLNRNRGHGFVVLTGAVGKENYSNLRNTIIDITATQLGDIRTVAVIPPSEREKIGYEGHYRMPGEWHEGITHRDHDIVRVGKSIDTEREAVGNVVESRSGTADEYAKQLVREWVHRNPKEYQRLYKQWQRAHFNNPGIDTLSRRLKKVRRRG